MDLLKKIFPLSFKYVKDVKDLIVGIILYVIGGAIGGVALACARHAGYYQKLHIFSFYL